MIREQLMDIEPKHLRLGVVLIGLLLITAIAL